MTIQRYETFIKIVDCGSLTKAALELGYTQPAISHILNTLERELQTSLMIRDRSGIKLTADGLKLMPAIRKVCNAHRELLEERDALYGLESGFIRIGTFTSVAVNWLPFMIKHFQRDYPKIDFELLYGDYTTIENWIREGRIDFGFLRLPAGDLESVFIEDERLLVVLPQDHPYAKHEAFPVEQLANERFILLHEGVENEFMDIFDDLGIAPRICFSAWENQAVVAMVENGLGISILPELALKNSTRKIAALPLSKPYCRKLGVVLKSVKNAPIAAKQFLSYLHHRG